MYDIHYDKYVELADTACRAAAVQGGDNMRLGNNLKRCRFDRGDLSQEALARAVGVTRQTIISIEKGHFVPSTLLALRLVRFFGKPLEDVFFIVEDTLQESRDL